jgi:glycosyltransferase involved in cell wall biosynthesis
MRVCVVYDCLFPHTVGGAERWYRHLAERLAERGHEVTYLTRLQWDPADPPAVAGVEVVAVSRAEELYDAGGRRKIGQTLRFGRGVLAHLLRHRRDYDVVHLCAFPYFSLLAARLALAGTPVRVFVDWFEVWTSGYWDEYLGGLRGAVGHAVQRVCARVTPAGFVFSDLHGRRLREEGMRADPVKLPGLYTGPTEPPAADPRAEREPVVLFAGRHIPEKRVPAIVPAIAAARRSVPGLRGVILGDGPERAAVQAAIAASALGDVISAPGFVAAGEVRRAMAEAEVLLLPSRREGYGMVVIEAAACGTPSVVVAGADNAAVELVHDGVNGFVAVSEDPADIAAALIAVHESGGELRASTAAWFAAAAPRLSADASVDAVLAAYESARS